MGTAVGSNGLTAYQSVMPSSTEVGQMATVIVYLTYNGQNSAQATVTPSLPPGVVANSGGQSLELYPGQPQEVSYPLTAQQSGSYWIVSDISYSEDGYWRSLRLEAPFTATEPVSGPQPTQPGPDYQNPNISPGSGSGSNPTDPYGAPPAGAMPGGEYGPGNRTDEPPADQQPGGFDGPAGSTGQEN